MQRLSVFALLWLVAIGSNVAAAQDDEKPLQKLFKPIKEFRTRHCNPNPVKGCMCAKCKAKRKKKLCERCIEKAKKAAEKEKEKQQLIMDLEKLALEMKKLQEEKKDFEKELEEKNKPWDITDEKESENELLKMAAAAKADQDLEPKKIEALQYIAGLGCAKVPDAPKIILAGLQDPNVNVRAAAIQAILSPYLTPYDQYGGFYASVEFSGLPPRIGVDGKPLDDGTTVVDGSCPTCCSTCNNRSSRRDDRRAKKACDFCQHKTNLDAVIAQLNPDCPEKKCEPCDQCNNRRTRTRRKRTRCGFCRGGGCQNCKYSGQIEYLEEMPCDCQPQKPNLPDLTQCQSTDSCQACCTKEIQKELKEMAYGTKESGCFYEPNEVVRNMAAQALEMCPGLPEPQKDMTEEADLTEEADMSEESDYSEEETPSEDLSDEEADLDLEGQNGEEDADGSTYFRGTNRRYARPVSSVRNYSDEAAGPITHTIAFVSAANADRTIEIRLTDEFLIPTRYSVEIETEDGQRYEGIVVSSSVGRVTIKPVNQNFNVRTGDKIRFGVVAAYPGEI